MMAARQKRYYGALHGYKNKYLQLRFHRYIRLFRDKINLMHVERFTLTNHSLEFLILGGFGVLENNFSLFDLLVFAERLIVSGAKYTSEFITNLMCEAIYQYHLKLFIFLLGTDSNINVNKLLPFACRTGATTMVKLLLDEGADPNIGLNEITQQNQINLARMLIMRGASPKICINKEKLLHACANQKDAQMAELLLDSGADINGKNRLGHTPLISACLVPGPNIPFVRCLVERGADLNFQNEVQLTALHIAVSSGKVNLVNILVRGGADRTLKDRLGRTPAMLVTLNKWRILQILNS